MVLIFLKATQTISSALFKELDYFEELTPDLTIKKSLIYGGNEDQQRTRYHIISWKNVSLCLPVLLYIGAILC